MSQTLIRALRLFSLIFFWALIVRIIIEWFNPRAIGGRDAWGSVYSITYRATEPVLQPIRRLVPDLGGLDISPILAIFAIDIITRLLSSLLARVGW